MSILSSTFLFNLSRLGGRNLFLMMHLTEHLQMIAERCEQVVFAFKFSTFSGIGREDNFCQMKKQ